ncbi:hypothetical protein DWQ65_11210 [Treponema phagedenis]|uniref:Ig-like domain-containing protein n=1 Tax=Treponema phagedenis TaxID=162 RepID=UPI00197FB9C6|nr:Ig-like domain-containing protein [Treponema phagedenis]QSI00616.1 hypothetical protein DWQ65_11210 [Treponema phagedenis]
MSSETPDRYGKDLWLEGMSADDSGVSKIVMRAYADKEGTTLLAEKTLENVPPTVEIKVGSHNGSNNGNKKDDFYNTIYNKRGKNPVYCTIEIFDNAKQYTKEGASGEGNSTTSYYLYAPLYDEVFSLVNTNDIYRAFAGFNIAEDKGLDKGKIISLLSKDNAAVSEAFKANGKEKGSFTLDPDASPEYELLGFQAVAEDAGVDSYNTIGKGSTITVQLSAGLDKAPLDKNSFVFCYMTKETYEKYRKDPALQSFGQTPESLFKDNSKKEIRDGIIQLDAKLTPQGTSYIATYTFKDKELKVNHPYVFIAAGREKKGRNKLGNQLRMKTETAGNCIYGFKVAGLVDIEPPRILPEYPQEGVLFDPAKKISAIIFDASGIQEAKVHYRYGNGEEKEALLSPESGKANMYTAALPAADLKEGQYEVWFTAIDKAEPPNTNTGANSKITVTYDKEDPDIKNVQVNGTAISNGGKLNVKSNDIHITGEVIESHGLEYLKIKGDGVTFSSSGDAYSFDRTLSLDDGDHFIKIEAKDKAGKVSSIEFTLCVDTTAPTFDEMKVAEQSANNGSSLISNSQVVTITGKVTDGTNSSGIDVVEYSLDNRATWRSLVGTREQNGIYIINDFVSVNIGGAKTIHLQAKDYAGNKTEQWSCNVTVTSNIPTITLEVVPPTAGNSKTFERNGLVYLKGTTNIQIYGQMEGASGAESLEVTLKKDSISADLDVLFAEPNKVRDLKIQPNNNGLAASLFAVKTGSKDGEYRITAKQGTHAKTVKLIIDNTPPKVESRVPFYDSASSTEVYKFTSLQNFYGTITDGSSGSGVKSITAKIDGANHELIRTGGAWESKEVPSIKEGNHMLVLNYEDNLGNKGTQLEIPFVYDKADPKISDVNIGANTIDNGGKINVKSNSITIKGIVTETNGLEYIQAKDGTNTKKATLVGQLAPDGKNNFSFDFTDLVEGEHPFEVEAKDKAGKNSERFAFKVFVDTKAPKLMDIKTDDANGEINGTDLLATSSTVKISGKVKDDAPSSGIDVVQYVLTDTTPDWTKASSFSLKGIGAELDFEGYVQLEKGKKLHIRALDKAKNPSELQSYTVTLDTEPPKVTRLEVAAVTSAQHTQVIPATATEPYYGKGKLQVNLTVSDDTGVQSVMPIIKKDGIALSEADSKGFFANFDTDFKKAVDANSKEPAIQLTIKDGTQDGTYEIGFKIEDKAKPKPWEKSETITLVIDNKESVLTPIVPVEGQPFSNQKVAFNGTISDIGSGVEEDSFTYEVKDSNGVVVSATPITITGSSWKIDGVNLGTKEGEKTITFKAKDKLGNPTEETKTVYYDKANPTLTEVKVNNQQGNLVYVKKDVSTPQAETKVVITGQATDTNKMQKVAVFEGAEEKGTTAGDVDGDWSIELAVPGTLAEGIHNLTIKAIDIAGKETIAKKTVVVDTTAPKLDITTLGDKTILSNDFSAFSSKWIGIKPITVAGSAQDTGTDPAGIDRVEYAFKKGTANIPNDAWRLLNLTSTANNAYSFNEEFAIPSDAVALHFRCIDKAGNVTELTPIALQIDSTPPQLEVTEIDGKAGYKTAVTVSKKDISIKGAVTDLNAANQKESGVAKVVWTLDGSAEKERTVSQSGEWAVSIPAAEMKAGMLTITAIDTVGNISAPKNIVFLLDEDAPTAKIINFDANSTQTGSITVKGLVEDIGNAGVDSSATAWKIVKRNDPDPEEDKANWPEKDDLKGWKKVDKPTVGNWEITTLDLSRYITADGTTANQYKSEYAVQRGADILFDLPLYVFVKDSVGNAKVVKLNILVDPAGDIPVVKILYPQKNGDTVGGLIKIYGTAAVNDPAKGSVENVYIQITKNKDGNGNPTFDSPCTFGGKEWCTPGTTHGVQLTADEFKAGSGFWALDINRDKEFEETGNNTQQTIWFRLRGKNTTNKFGAWTEPFKLIVDKNAPKITAAKVATEGNIGSAPTGDFDNRFYVPNMWIKGDDLYLCADLSHTAGIKSVEVSGTLNCLQSNRQDLKDDKIVGVNIAGTGKQWFFENPSGSKNYQMRIPLKTTDNPGSNNEFSITVKITSNVSTSGQESTAESTWTLKYDNAKPAAVFGAKIKASPMKISGASFTDASLIDSKIDTNSMYVFAAGEARKITGFNETSGTVTLESALSGESSGYIIYSPADYTWNTGAGLCTVEGIADDVGAGVKTVKAALKINGTTTPDKVLNFPQANGLTSDIGTFVIWKGEVNTTGIPDGQGMLTFTVTDEAGNESTSSVTLKLKNNPLQINKLGIGTDLNYSETIGDGEGEFAWQNISYLPDTDSGVDRVTKDWSGTVTANLSFKNPNSQIKVESSGGNGTIKYTLKCGTETIHSLADLPTGGIIPLTANDFAKIGQGNKTLVLTLWDAAAGLTQGTDTWKAEATITVKVDTTDQFAPTAGIKPLHWTSKTDNSLYKNSELQGHIELKNGTSGNDKVSGKISIRGTAQDNQIITEIWAAITDFEFAAGIQVPVEAKNADRGIKIAEYSRKTKEWIYCFDQNNNKYVRFKDGTLQFFEASNAWKEYTWDNAKNKWYLGSGSTKSYYGQKDVSNTGWFFEVTKSTFSQDSGHDIAWQLDWDTSKITGGAGENKTVKLFVKDSTNYSPQGAITVDVVPYITKVTTALSTMNQSQPSENDRTALGHYPVCSDETITVEGFNLTDAVYKIGGTNLSAVSGAVTAIPNGATIAVASAAASGELTATVNGVSSINNKNNNETPYNKKEMLASHQRLTDDVVIDIWQINSEAALPGRGIIAEPVMHINPVNGIIGFAFANGPDYFSMSNGTTNSYQKWHGNYDDFGCVAFVYDAAGNAHATVVGRDINSGENHGGKFTYMCSKWGAPSLEANNNYEGANALRLEAIGQIGFKEGGSEKILDKTRIRTPSLAVARHNLRVIDRNNNLGNIIKEGNETETTIYLAYYDSLNNELRFKYGNLNDTFTKKRAFNQFVDQETSATVSSYNDKNVSIVAGVDKNNNDTGNKAGNYLSLAVVPSTKTIKVTRKHRGPSVLSQIINTEEEPREDIVVLVWYDPHENRLQYSYKEKPQNKTNATQAGNGNKTWKAPITIFKGAGEHCQIAVDKNGGIHIAAYNTQNANLVYAFLSRYDNTNPKTCIVDSYGLVGTHITLDVALNTKGNPVPYIGYYADFAGLPKIAYLKDGVANAADKIAAGAESDRMTGNWEISYVPSMSRPKRDRINAAVWKDTDGKIKNSTTGTDASDNERGSVYGNGTANPVLGYVIYTGTLETAQKK